MSWALTNTWPITLVHKRMAFSVEPEDGVAMYVSAIEHQHTRSSKMCSEQMGGKHTLTNLDHSAFRRALMSDAVGTALLYLMRRH